MSGKEDRTEQAGNKPEQPEPAGGQLEQAGHKLAKDKPDRTAAQRRRDVAREDVEARDREQQDPTQPDRETRDDTDPHTGAQPGETGETGEQTRPGGPQETRAPGEEEPSEAEQGPSGATLTPEHVRYPEPAPEVQPETVAEAGEPQANPNAVEDGVEDQQLGRPVVGQWVQIINGEYAGRFAAYLGNLAVPEDDSEPRMIQVRTRDADNLILDVAYDDVSATTYSGGR